MLKSPTGKGTLHASQSHIIHFHVFTFSTREAILNTMGGSVENLHTAWFRPEGRRAVELGGR